MTLEARILKLGDHIGTLARRLPELGYRFADPSNAFPGPEPGTDQAIARIEREVGPLPLAIKLFWRNVGSVDFTWPHGRWDVPEYPWQGCEYPDPLFVCPPSRAILDLEAFLSDQEERLRCNYPYLVEIAPDQFHKENVSGGVCYNLSVPAIADDPPLNDERHQTTFVGYLELAIRMGGFPGLDQCPEHDWPIHELTRGLALD